MASGHARLVLGARRRGPGQRLETGITGVGMGRKRAGQGIRKGVVKFFWFF